MRGGKKGWIGKEEVKGGHRCSHTIEPVCLSSGWPIFLQELLNGELRRQTGQLHGQGRQQVSPNIRNYTVALVS